MTKIPLWSPNNKDNYLKQFQKININHVKDDTYESLHSWSVNNKKDFWSSIWDFTNIIGSKKGPIIQDEKDFINSKFFNNSKLNFTENLIKKKNDDDAIVFFSEQKINRRVSWKKLNKDVNKLSHYLKEININKGDRIAGILPNIPEAVISFLATAKIGAIWSSCSSDFGTKAIIDRFQQIDPKVLIISDMYFYNNKKIETLGKINEILKDLPTVIEIIIIPYEGIDKKFNINFSHITWFDIINQKEELIKYQQFNFNTPLYILFSSGTTGVPKCIVHGAGGSLIQHKKEHLIHCDINMGDKVLYFTTCGWMMWNWLISCLSSNASIYLYDGSPFFPSKEYLFQIINEEKISFFGTGAKYLDYLKQYKINIKKNYNLYSLKTIASTGSPLVHETFEYVYKYIKDDVHLASISGGTDIVSCFVLGNPNLNVYAGEIQSKGLGMDVDIFDDLGNPIKNQKGELVCKSTFPSKPIYFWKDKSNKKYFNSYFSKYNNIWRHGDYAKITKNNGFIIYGRSDTTLNSGGVRIGTSELYRVVENFEKVQECIAVEHKIYNDTEIILFLKLKNKIIINNDLEIAIKDQIKTLLSHKHVPAKIIQIKDIPKTKSGKIVELCVKKIINNEKINNLNILANPECLSEYMVIAKELKNE